MSHFLVCHRLCDLGQSTFYMAQRSVLMQTTRPQTIHHFVQHCLGIFFSEDQSPDNHHTIILQQRAVWIALALFLFSLIELFNWLFALLGPLGTVLPFMLTLGSFAAMWKSFYPATPQQQAGKRSTQRSIPLWQRLVFMLSLILSLVGIVEMGMATVMCFMPPQFSNDGTSLDTNAAMLLVHGRNPYTDSNMLDMYRKFRLEPNWTTPLRKDQFANRLDYPTVGEFRSVLDTALKSDGVAPEFESKVSYPALSFLTLVPFALFDNYNVLPFYFLSYLTLIFIAWKAAHPTLRPWILLLSMSNVPMWSSTVGANLDIFYTLLIVLVWLLREYRWSSAIFLGLAIASKQIAWFFVPFYAIMILRRYGSKETIARLLIAGSVAFAINLPFMLWNLQAWLAGVMAPVADPMFPLGIGIISFSLGHWLPFFSSWVYTALELSTMIGALLLYWRVCRRYPEVAMLLAVLPLFFAWRSLPSYFACVAYPLFVISASNIKPGVRRALSTVRQRTMAIPLRIAVGMKIPASI